MRWRWFRFTSDCSHNPSPRIIRRQSERNSLLRAGKSENSLRSRYGFFASNLTVCVPTRQPPSTPQSTFVTVAFILSQIAQRRCNYVSIDGGGSNILDGVPKALDNAGVFCVRASCLHFGRLFSFFISGRASRSPFFFEKLNNSGKESGAGTTCTARTPSTSSRGPTRRRT